MFYDITVHKSKVNSKLSEILTCVTQAEGHIVATIMRWQEMNTTSSSSLDSHTKKMYIPMKPWLRSFCFNHVLLVWSVLSWFRACYIGLECVILVWSVFSWFRVCYLGLERVILVWSVLSWFRACYLGFECVILVWSVLSWFGVCYLGLERVTLV